MTMTRRELCDLSLRMGATGLLWPAFGCRTAGSTAGLRGVRQEHGQERGAREAFRRPGPPRTDEHPVRGGVVPVVGGKGSGAGDAVGVESCLKVS